MNLSQLALEIKESPTLALNEKARVLKEKGEAVIHLGAGEPKSKVPFDAILSSAARLNTAEIRYTPTEGIPELIKAVVRYTEQHYQKIVGPQNVIVASGAKQAFYNLMMTLLNPQDEVLLLAPYWVSYPEIIRMLHGKPVVVAPGERFQPRLDDISRAVTAKTKAIVVNSPNNPSGVVYPEDLIRGLVEFCEKKGLYLIMDDIYHKLVFDGKTAPSCYAFAKDHSDSSRLIVINGVSKMYAMTGFRIGWIVANTQIVKTCINVAAQNTSCPSVVTQAAAVGALNGDQSGVDALRLTLENNRNVMMNELNSIAGLKTTKPDGTFYCLPDFSAYDKDSGRLSKFLLEKALVVAVPGVEFGMEGHLRLSYCGTIKEIKEGVARIKWALDPKSPDEIFIGDRKTKRNW